ncbi:MAG: SPOR domain-containing protein [Prevotella sp.]|nr:SPOR domain-containing protein [Prevotella sp.]
MERHIELLLMKYDCVILPGFGGFVKHHISAGVEPGTGMMLPPRETVGFNPQLTINDSLLVQSYVETYDYSFPEALAIVEREIMKLRDTLRAAGHYELRSVGTLMTRSDGAIVFEPARPGIINPQLYGLPGIEATPVDYDSPRAGNDVALSAGTTSADGEEPAGDYIVIRIPRRALRRMATACVVLLLLAAIPFVSRKVNTGGLVSGINLDFICNLMPKADTTHKTETPVDTDAAYAETAATDSIPATAKEEETVADTIAATPGQPAFTIVFASRISEKNAHAYADKLSKENNIPARVAGGGKEIKVIYGSFPTREEAQQERRRLAADPQFADIWITSTAVI